MGQNHATSTVILSSPRISGNYTNHRPIIKKKKTRTTGERVRWRGREETFPIGEDDDGCEVGCVVRRSRGDSEGGDMIRYE